ncbi:hypothetical protein EWM64_g3585 [Hericium alpestre]|uniref:Cytochrome P450 n=1 Tax=Hericium alpestre TaxID=135208 RepID=A0A4Z0A1V2_9AGAM|nr:hypothetical protein EWM64_g3585 [Hericium alpestre]
MIGSFFLGLVPSFLKPAAGKLFTTLSGSHRRIFKHLEPIIAERKAKIAEYGPDYPGKPNDLLSWFMDAAPAPYDTAESLALRILDTNFVALHSTSMSFVHALYHLASKPSYVDALRAEVLENLGIESAGWTQNAFSHCWKLDSFLKESQRLNGLGALSLPRKAMRSYTFRDGTTIPEGTMIAATQTATHLDEAYYLDPDEFDGYRFSKLREQAVGKDQSNNSDETEQGQDEDWRHRLTGTGSGYLAFGGGRHVCPGRFFASLELKCMMAYILLSSTCPMPVLAIRLYSAWADGSLRGTLQDFMNDPVFYVAIFISLIFISLAYRATVYPYLLSPLKHIPGPSLLDGHLLLGHYPQILASEAGQIQKYWVEKYGSTVKAVGPFGLERLIFTSPKALRAILVEKASHFDKASVYALILSTAKPTGN